MSLENLKSMRGSSIDKLVQAAEAVSTKAETKSYDDDRFWKPTRDKAGNGYAVVRFLPAKEGEDLPWVRYWDHGFKGPTGLWYIENSLTSIGQDDPVSESNSVLWNSGRDEDKALARERKRRLHYISNVLVVSDPENPQNEGKVFLYQFGKKIFDKIMDKMKPQFEDEQPTNPFDPWKGCNFKLKVRKVEGFTNYDKSEFDSSTAIFEDDGKIETLWKSQYKLAPFLDASNFKSYDELKAKLDLVLNVSASATPTAPMQESERTISTVSSPSLAPASVGEHSTVVEEEDDEAMSYFSKLANE